MNLFVFGIISAELVWDFFEYQYYKSILDAIKNAPVFDAEVASSLRQGEDIPYCIVQGRVKAIEGAIHSVARRDVTGVIQRLKVVQYLADKDIFGNWRLNKETVRDGVEWTRFGLLQGSTLLRMTDKFVGNTRLVHIERTGYELRQVSDVVTGMQQVFELTERMLREGTPVTALGRVIFDGKDFVITLPAGMDHYLTTDSVATIEEAVASLRTISKMYVFLFGGFALIMVCSYLFFRYQDYRLDRQRRAFQSQIQEQEVDLEEPAEDLSYGQRCVVCRYYPRDIVLMPCKHFCLCQACLLPMYQMCPVCRGRFNTTLKIFVA